MNKCTQGNLIKGHGRRTSRLGFSMRWTAGEAGATFTESKSLCGGGAGDETQHRLTHEHEISDVEDGAGSEHQMTDEDEAVYTGQLSVWGVHKGVHTSDSRRAKTKEATKGGRGSAEAAEDFWRFELVGEGLCVFGDGSRCEGVDVEGEGERVRGWEGGRAGRRED